MEQVLSGAAAASEAKRIAFWRNPVAWLQEKKLSKGYWVLYTAFFFFHTGIAAYYFLFNLYLLDCHFNDRAIGLVGGAISLGTAAGALPAGLLAKKAGMRPLLLACFVATPAIGALRAVMIWEAPQIFLAFCAGLASCLSGVCCLPAVARLSTEENRAAAFGLIYSTSVGMSALSGMVCGYLPLWMHSAGLVMEPAEAKRIMLLAACAIAATGLLAIVRLRIPQEQYNNSGEGAVEKSAPARQWRPHPFLLRFFPALILWTAVLTSFAPFSNVYLSQGRHIPLSKIGVIFFMAQIIQSFLGLLSTVLFRKLGLVNGIVVTQVLTAITLSLLGATQNIGLVAPLFIAFTSIQWMSTPGLENLLMSGVPDVNRSSAASMMMFCNAVVAAAATSGTGILFVRFGYPHVMFGISALALIAATLFRTLISSPEGHAPAQVQH